MVSKDTTTKKTATASKTAPKVVKKAEKAEKTEEVKGTVKVASKPKTLKKESESLEFAVILTGGKQYQVKVGDILKIEKMPGEFKKGEKITFEQVLLVDNGSETTIGTPYISGAKVEAIFEEEGKNKKLEILRYKAKSRYLKRKGHRQPYFKVKIEAIK